MGPTSCSPPFTTTNATTHATTNTSKKRRYLYSFSSVRYQRRCEISPPSKRPRLALPCTTPIPIPPVPRQRPTEALPPAACPMTSPAVPLPQPDPHSLPPSLQNRLPPAPLPLLGQHRLQGDSLGKSALASAALLESGMSFPELCKHHRGPSCLADPNSLPHSAAAFLSTLRTHGAPVPQLDSPWPLERLDWAAQRGPHQSTREHIEFMRQEFSEMIDAGQWLALPYKAVRHLPNLRISPTGVVPQRDRRPRPIVDYTFSSVNAATDSQAPDSLQFGTALFRFLQQLERADTRRGPTYLSKTDIADAFMRVWIALDSIPVLAAVLPSYPGEDPIIAFPMILPMGWVDSPNYLCALTETIADMVNARTAANDLATVPHPLDGPASTEPVADTTILASLNSFQGPPPPITRSCGPLRPPLTYTDVYMDDFLMATQQQNRSATRSTLFECIDAVLRPLSPQDNPCRKEPISLKKLLKGDACWATRKSVLGWIIDTVRRTIELPSHRLERLHTILSTFPHHQRRTSRRKWQQLLGELRSMVLAIPGGRGLFSQLQSVLVHSDSPRPSDRLRLSPPVHDQLDDLRWLAQDLGSRPTRWAEAVDSDPAFLGTTDASGAGMGGTWLSTAPGVPPLVWRLPFPDSIQAQLVTRDNPTGTLTNSDLEQLAITCHPDILACEHDIRERTICILSDNTAAVSREQRGSTSTNSPAAYLCRLAALHQRANRYRLSSAYLPGVLNIMADDASRATVETLQPAVDDELEYDTGIINAALRSSLSHGRNVAAASYWQLWQGFCQQYGLAPYFGPGSSPIRWLSSFAVRVRDGRLSSSRRPVGAATVASALSFIATAHTMAGLPDPRLIVGTATVDPRLTRLLASFRKADPPPARYQPIPLPVLHAACRVARAAADPYSMAAADMMWIAFFYLLRPGEYLCNTPEAHPFTLQDVRLWHGTQPLDPLTAPVHLLEQATFAALVFTTQKNCVRGEVIGHGCTGHTWACPTKSIVRRLVHLRSILAPPETPLCTVGPLGQHTSVRAITSLLRQGALVYSTTTRTTLPSLHLRALRATGASALLSRDVHGHEIQLLGRWKSDSMLRYLHLQSHSRMSGYAQRMLEGSTNPSTIL